MNMENNNNPNQIDIELPAEVAEGLYSNLPIVSHSPNEFVIDFANYMPGMPKAVVVSRIIVTPQNAKHLLRTLEMNIRMFEKTHGRIKEQDNNIPLNFGTPPAQA